MTEQTIEQEIQAKGLNAPRVTPDRINSVISAEYYFTAEEATRGSPQLPQLGLLTICVLVLRNGFTVLGKSACASPENFDRDLGNKIARQDAVNQIWALEGYLLKQQLFESPPVTAG
jgi:hypothetical protein